MFKAIVNNKDEINFDVKNGEILLRDEPVSWDILKTNPSTYHLIKDGKSITIEVLKKDPSLKFIELKINQTEYKVELKDKSDLLLKKLGLNNLSSETTKDIKAPMPGLILDILVAEGAEVKKGDPLLILEAMKMENLIKSPNDGIVKSIKVEKGKSVEKNQILIQF